MPFWVILGQNLKKKIYRHICNQHPKICQNAKFYVKQKTFKFGIKIVLFGFSGVVILKNYCSI